MARGDDGSFRLHAVVPGLYSLIAAVDNHVGARQEISIGDSDMDGVILTITDPGNVKGRVQIEPSGAPNSPSVKGLRVSLNPMGAGPMNVPNASTGDDGSFTMDEVLADRYKVNSSPLEGAYLKTIRWNGQVSNDGTVDVSGSGTASLELTFASTTALIEGDVKTADDKPAAGARVVLVPTSKRESDLRTISADQNGHFVAKNVAPGTYTVLAPDADIFGMPDAEFLKGLEKQSTSVTVDEKGHATTTLKVISAAEIEAAQ